MNTISSSSKYIEMNLSEEFQFHEQRKPDTTHRHLIRLFYYSISAEKKLPLKGNELKD